jgi:hypothetical protein
VKEKGRKSKDKGKIEDKKVHYVQKRQKRRQEVPSGENFNFSVGG